MNTIKVLVAEDHEITRQGICRLIADERNLVLVGETGNGEDAVRKASELQPDVIIMDLGMPKLNGLEATKQIKQLLPTTAVLILTAYDDDEYVFGLLEIGAAGYLLKTTSGEGLIQAIRAVHRGEPVLDPVVARKVINHFRSLGRTRHPAMPSTHLRGRELDVIKLAAKGMSNRDIADELHLSRRTVESNLRTIFNKLGVGSRTEAVIQAMARGLFTMKDLS
ncbi:response regulator [Chloroflexota bacterium]